MNRCVAIPTIILICFLFKAKGQSVHLEKGWIKRDSVFIENLAKAYRVNPINVEGLLSYKGNKRENLGFGYYLISGSTGKGYVSIFYQFIYHRNKLVSYKLDPQMPSDSRLIDRYLKFYVQLFKVNRYRSPEPIYYRYDEMTEPLNNSKTSIHNSDILFFMTPYSGVMYGDYGGIGSTMLDNRVNYLRIKNAITPEICELLLYSKNPATRLSAIEYYYKNSNSFLKYKEKFEKRIKVIFNELPEVSTMSVDLEITKNAKDLVNSFAKKH